MEDRASHGTDRALQLVAKLATRDDARHDGPGEHVLLEKRRRSASSLKGRLVAALAGVEPAEGRDNAVSRCRYSVTTTIVVTTLERSEDVLGVVEEFPRTTPCSSSAFSAEVRTTQVW